jgi:galactokinase
MLQLDHDHVPPDDGLSRLWVCSALNSLMASRGRTGTSLHLCNGKHYRTLGPRNALPDRGARRGPGTKLADIIDYKYRVSYSRLERTKSHTEIEHPVVRMVIEHYGLDAALDISIQSDLPASSGLGSSSAFTVGLVNLAATLKSKSMTRLDLARAAIHIEQGLLKENVGVQDQLHAAFGGMNRFDFVDGRIRITPVQMSAACLDRLLASLLLVYTGRTRFASEVVADQVAATREKKIDRELTHLLELVSQAGGRPGRRRPGSHAQGFRRYDARGLADKPQAICRRLIARDR